MAGLNKTEIIVEKLNQCIPWAQENPEEQIQWLSDCEVFWETPEGMEFSESIDFLDTVEEAIEVIHQLSDFINENIDPKNCLPNGVPALATSNN